MCGGIRKESCDYITLKSLVAKAKLIYTVNKATTRFQELPPRNILETITFSSRFFAFFKKYK